MCRHSVVLPDRVLQGGLSVEASLRHTLPLPPLGHPIGSYKYLKIADYTRGRRWFRAPRSLDEQISQRDHETLSIHRGTGTGDGFRLALDAKDGHTLWSR